MSETVNFKRTLFTCEQLDERVHELGRQISKDYADEELIIVGVLKGSFYFLADLTRCIDVPLKLDFMSIGVYQGVTNRTGVVRIIKDLEFDVTGKHVLIVEDIIRTGLTTGYLVKNIEGRGPKSVKVCTLLQNPDQLLLNIPISYVGFTVSGSWLAGYGMDIGERWRNLPYIAEVERIKS